MLDNKCESTLKTTCLSQISKPLMKTPWTKMRWHSCALTSNFAAERQGTTQSCENACRFLLKPCPKTAPQPSFFWGHSQGIGQVWLLPSVIDAIGGMGGGVGRVRSLPALDVAATGIGGGGRVHSLPALHAAATSSILAASCTGWSWLTVQAVKRLRPDHDMCDSPCAVNAWGSQGGRVCLNQPSDDVLSHVARAKSKLTCMVE
jgi:hypothetical protein